MRKTLDSLYRSLVLARSRNLDLGMEVVIVDNSTSQPYRDALRRFVTQEFGDRFDRLHIIGTESNVGYGSAHNRALREVDSDMHIVLNPDVELAEASLGIALEYLFVNDDVVLVSPHVVNAEGAEQYLCKRYPSILVLALRGFAPTFIKNRLRSYMHSYEIRDACHNGAVTDVPLAGGCCMFARTDALQRAGGFSDTFFMYFEDFDLSLRLLPLGRIVYLPSVEIVHHGGFSARKGLRHIGMFIHSGWKFFQRHGWCWI